MPGLIRYRGAVYRSVGAKGMTNRLQNPNQLYLRIGKNFGASKFGLDEEWQRETGKRYERGTSCYFVYPYQDGYEIGPPDRNRAMYGIVGDYFLHMFTEVLIKPICASEIYLVKGRLFPVRDYPDVGHDDDTAPTSYWNYDVGSDGEPVLQPHTIKVVQQVPLEQFLKTFYLNRGFAVGDLLEPGWGSGRKTLSRLYDEGNFEVEFCGADDDE